MNTESVLLSASPAEAIPADGRPGGIGNYPQRLLVRDSGTIHVVKVGEIEWIDACGNYVEIHSRGRTYLHRGSMNGICERLSPKRFTRLHRSTIINRDKVLEVRTVAKGQYVLVMNSGDELRTRRPLSEIREIVVLA